MNTKKLYENIENLKFSKKTKKGLLGVIDQKVDDNTQKVLDKLDTINKIVIGIGVTVIGSVIAGAVMTFLNNRK